MTKKTKKQQAGELVYGINPVTELLKAKRRKLISIYTTKPEPKAWADIKKLLPKHVPVQYVKRDALHKIADTTDHQGVVAWAQPFAFRKKFFDPNKQKFLVMLDSLQDVRNLGAILRSSYCTGVDGVILTKKNSAPLNAAALKASAGLAEHLEIFVATSPQAAVQELKQAGYNLYLAAFGGEDATKVAFKQPMCIVIGSEGPGITKSILNEGTQVTLPQKTNDISYNASVAAGILLFLAATQQGRM